MADVAKALNLSSFAYLGLPKKGGDDPNLISTYPPGWTTRYLQLRYQELDPVVRQAIIHARPFRWGPGFGPPICSDS
ncbi:autoinducer binding domain-containing protein, partial [Bradyrhizobium sp. 35]|uniref:autoinducer binding domain-containing protein n=1 Tax=Bradyrhizobium sp. 35 TaxID=2782670 RepID=UPI001FFAE3C4